LEAIQVEHTQTQKTLIKAVIQTLILITAVQIRAIMMMQY